MFFFQRKVFTLAALLAVVAPAFSQPGKQEKMIYSYVTHDPKMPADMRAKLIGLWKQEIEANTKEMGPMPTTSKLTGHAPAHVLIGMSSNVVATILLTVKTCENTGSTAEEGLCSAKIIADGKVVMARACFIEAEFGPLPGETPSNTYSAILVDPEMRTVTFDGIRKGKPIRKCHRVVKY